MKWKKLRDWFPVGWRESLLTAGILIVAVICCALLHGLDASGSYASMVFVLAVVCVARVTTGYLYGILASFVGVVATNYTFTYPYGAFNFTIAGYPLTFCVSARSRSWALVWVVRALVMMDTASITQKVRG